MFKIRIGMAVAITVLGASAAHADPVGPLAALPSKPGPHIEKIRAMADGTWLSLGSPAADPKWGKARGRAWSAPMPYAADRQAAFLTGEGVHGWFNKETNRYMDDLWAYDVNAHRWICLYPGADVKNISLKTNADGFEVDQNGQPIPVAQMAHAFSQVTYDSDRKRFQFMPCPGPDWVIALGERRKSWNGLLKWPYVPPSCSPWLYNVATGQFELHKVKGAIPPVGGMAYVLVYLPSLKKSFYYRSGQKDVWLYDAADNTWSKLTPKGPPPPFGIDANACLDLKRGRIYLGGGYYPVAAGPSAFWCYDVAANAWIDLAPKGKPCLGCKRYGPNQALMHYDAASDAVVLFYHRLPQAMPDGDFNPGAKAFGIYIYDPAANTWSETPLPLAKETGQCPSGFFSPDLNAHFIHCAGDSADNGVMSVYRYKGAQEPARKPDPESPSAGKIDRSPKSQAACWPQAKAAD
jgi:hypothetical protein